MYSLFPVFIPSKGRPCAKIFKRLPRACIVVEPQDEEVYRINNPNHKILVLPSNDQGIAFVRQYILSFARSFSAGWIWMLDDDIGHLYERFGQRLIKQEDFSNILIKAQSIFLGFPNIGQASLEYRQFAWSAKTDFKMDGYCDVCVCINVKATNGINYRKQFSLKEDRDFTMQIIASGLNTMRISKYAFCAPMNGTNAGGLRNIYDQKTPEKQTCNDLVELWGSKYCSVHVKPSGRFDLKINWKAISELGKSKNSGQEKDKYMEANSYGN